MPLSQSHHKEQEELRIRREKEQAKAKARRERAKRFLHNSEDDWRQEVWVSHDGVRTDAQGDIKEDDKEEQSEEVKLRKMTPVEVSVDKYVHGTRCRCLEIDAHDFGLQNLKKLFSFVSKW